MSTEFVRVQNIFMQALERPLHEWDSFLDQVCGDDEALRNQIQHLLETHSREGGMLDSPVHLTATIAPQSERIGQRIGLYELVEKLGEGGMGTVYMAEQKEPIRRTVALKVINPGMDTRQFIARFEAERQTLALMNHPHIARVLDAGVADDGRPYFVMDLVYGIPITDYCEQHCLSRRERLELFVTVCEAVQHAHQKGVIHRDIKPGNVLVELHDVKHVPKVIDFGVAKATRDRLTDKTVITRFSQMIGTPMYMSPEQAELSGLHVDTRSDVYSLGVLLYELLTGTTPFEQDTFQKVSFDEMRRIIREDDPPRPSHRISTLEAAKLSTLVDRQKLEVKDLRRNVQQELDWIVMKALEKDRTRRYESPAALARDIGRYIDGEPVEACPPSLAYRLRKWQQRHRSLFYSAVAIFLVVLAAGIGSFVTIYSAYQRESTARQMTDEAWAQAEHNLQSALAVIDQAYLKEIDRLHQAGEAADEQEAFLLKAAELYKSLSARAAHTPELKEAMAGFHQRAGGIYTTLGKLDEAIAAAEKEVQLRRELLDKNAGRGQRELAFALLRYAQALLSDGDVDRASPVVKEYGQRIEKLVHEGGPAENLAIAYGLRADLFRQQGRLDDAIAQMRQAMDSFDKIDEGLGWKTLRKNKLKVRDVLGALYFQVGDATKTREISEELFELYDRFTEDAPSNWTPFDQRTIDLNWTAAAARIAFALQHEDLDRSVEILRRAAELSLEHLKTNPHDRPILERFVRIRSLLGKSLFMQGKNTEAAEVITTALDNMADWPKIDSTRGTLLHILGRCQFAAGDDQSARDSIESSAAIARELVRRAKEPAPKDFAELAYRLSNLGIIYDARLGNHARALELWTEALDYKQQLFQQFPNYRPQSPNRRKAFARLAERIGTKHMHRGEFKLALEHLRSAMEEQAAIFGNSHTARFKTFDRVLKVLEAMQQLDEANQIWQEHRNHVQVQDGDWQLNFQHPTVEYPLRISDPDEYQLYVRWGVSEDLYRDYNNGLIAFSLSHGNEMLKDWYQLERGPGEAEFVTPLRWSTFEITWNRHRIPPSPMLWQIEAPGDYVLRLHVQHPGRQYVDALVLQRSSLPAPQGSGPAETPYEDGIFLSQEGRFVIEAENSVSLTIDGSAATWRSLPSDVPLEEQNSPVFRGHGYIRFGPTESVDLPDSDAEDVQRAESNSDAGIDPHPPDS